MVELIERDSNALATIWQTLLLAASLIRDGCGGLRPPAFQMFRGVKQTVENTLERTGDTHVMHGTSDDKAIIFRQHVNELVDYVVVDASVPVGPAFSAVKASGDRLDTHMDDIKPDILFFAVLQQQVEWRAG